MNVYYYLMFLPIQCTAMLRKEIRLVVFISCFVLLLVLVYQFNFMHSSRSGINFIVDFTSVDQERFHLKQKQGETDHHDHGVLPGSVIHGVKRFLFFVGYTWSGHNLAASMLDAHPHIVISHEYSVFDKWQVQPNKHSDKNWLFNTLYSASHSMTVNHSTLNLVIPGSWQGRYETSLSIIGDNSGWCTTEVFKRDKQKFVDIYKQLKRTVQIPIDVIHVIRNPYDIIASMLLHEKNATFDYRDKKDSAEPQIMRFFEQVNSVVEMTHTAHLSVIEVHNIDMITKPKVTMRMLCDRLKISCSEQLLQLCTHKIFSSEPKSRHLMKWTPHLIELVAKNIQKYNHLKRYSFTS